MRISDWSSDVCSSDLVSGLLMMFSNLLFAVLASVGHSPLMLALAVGTENFTSGIGLTVFVTYLSGLSSLAYTATQFALLSSRSEEHTSELQSLMRISYAVFCLKKPK